MSYGLLILLAAALAALIVLGSAATAYVLTHPPRWTVGAAVARGLASDPAEAGAAYQTHQIRDGRGRAIDLWAVQGRNPAGPAVILLHGWGGSRLSGLNWLDALRPLASEVVLFDQRSHGEATRGACSWGRREGADVLAVVEWERERLKGTQPGPAGERGAMQPETAAPHDGRIPAAGGRAAGRRLVLMGCSMGAAIAMEAAERAGPDAVAAVVADSPYRRPIDAARRTMARAGLPGRPFAFLAFAMLGLTGCRFRHADTTAVAARLTQPLLVLHGAEDAVAPPEDARAIAEAAPNGRIRVFEAMEHLQAACDEPEAYAEALRRFLLDEPEARTRTGEPANESEQDEGPIATTRRDP